MSYAYFAVPLFLIIPVVALYWFITSPKKVLVKGQWIRFPLIHKKIISHNTALYRFGLPKPIDVLGLPIGQHISIRTSIEDRIVTRSYTPTSTNDEKGHFDLVIKTYPNGVISKYISELSIGDSIEVSGPKGQFVYETNMSERIGMIAGGTGITPMFQILQYILNDKNDKTLIDLVYANVKEEDILLRQELEEFRKKHFDRFKIFYVLNDPPANWTQGVGFVTKDIIKEHCPPPGPKVKLLFCGPPPMIKALCTGCEELGYDKANSISKPGDMLFKF